MTIDVETRNSALACPICRTASNEERSFEDVSLWRCPECDHCFTNQSRLKNLEEYDDTYYDKTLDGE